MPVQLAGKLAAYAHRPDVLVLGLPRGGVPVAYQVACALDAPLDVFVVRKLGVVDQEELARAQSATGAKHLNGLADMAFITVDFPPQHHRAHQRELALARQSADHADRGQGQDVDVERSRTRTRRSRSTTKAWDITSGQGVYDLPGQLSLRLTSGLPNVTQTEALKVELALLPRLHT